MSSTKSKDRVLRAADVAHVAQPVVVHSGTTDGAHGMTVVPIVADGSIVGLEVRCGCGAGVFIECDDDPHDPPAATSPPADDRSRS